jgi:hypothetical protein
MFEILIQSNDHVDERARILNNPCPLTSRGGKQHDECKNNGTRNFFGLCG